MADSALIELTTLNTILKGFEDHSHAYSAFEKLQANFKKWLPRGDQKTGVIGEFYGLLFAKHIYPNAEVCLSSACSDDLGDIVVTENEQQMRIQVKTVSAYSETRRTTKIDLEKLASIKYELYILSLDTNFRPDGFWIAKNIPKELAGTILRGITVMGKRPAGGTRRGTMNLIDWADNKVGELNALIDRLSTSQPNI